MKVLIYFNKKDVKDSGGPAGYLYNLLACYDGTEIDLLDASVGSSKTALKNFFKKAPPFLLYILKIIYHLKYLVSLKKGKKVNIDFSKYDVIHFHDCFSYYSVRKELKKFNGKIILTNHTPTTPQVEMFDLYLTKFERKYFLFERKIINNACDFAFRNCDYLIYPTVTSDESYYKDWKEYADIIRNKKIITLLTGVKPKSVLMDRDEFRKKYNIGKDDFVFCYVGRHVSVKGYDIFKTLYSVFKDDQRVKFLVAGSEGPLYGLKNDKWIEIGWTNDSGSVINACDCFVLPNKETYFDIVLLEVLSIGVPIITSFTGGNKYFVNKSDGIFLYKTLEELYALAQKITNIDRYKLKELGELNKELYWKEFNREKFLNDYLEVIRKVCQNEI